LIKLSVIYNALLKKAEQKYASTFSTFRKGGAKVWISYASSFRPFSKVGFGSATPVPLDLSQRWFWLHLFQRWSGSKSIFFKKV